jgi:hypothetical protein
MPRTRSGVQTGARGKGRGRSSGGRGGQLDGVHDGGVKWSNGGLKVSFVSRVVCCLLCRQSGVGQGRAGQRTEGRREGEHDPRTQSNRRRHSNAHPNHNTLNSTHTTHGNKASLPFFLARRPVAISAFLFLWPLFERPRLFFSFFLRSRHAEGCHTPLTRTYVSVRVPLRSLFVGVCSSSSSAALDGACQCQ